MTLYLKGIIGTKPNPYPYWCYSFQVGTVNVHGQYFGSLKEAYETGIKEKIKLQNQK